MATTNGGLISQKLGATGYDPSLGTVDPAKDTVSGQMTDLIREDSPYIQQNEASALQDANARGTLNSSMTIGAARAAAIRAALPIASQDASTYSTQRLANQGASNTAQGFNATANNQTNLQKTQGEQQIAAIGAGGEETRKNIGAQTSGSIAQTQAAGQVQSGLSAQAAQQQTALQAQQGEIQKQLQALQTQAASGLSAQQAQQQKDLLAQQAQVDRQLQELRGTQATSLQTLQGTQAETLQALKNASELNLQNVKGAQAEKLTQIDNTYKQLLQASSSAASTYVQVSKNINDAMSNPNLDAAAKQAAVDNNITVLQSSLAIYGGIAGIPDLPSLLSF